MPTLRLLRVLAPIAPLLLLGAAAPSVPPSYTAEGALVPPAEYRDWVFLTASFDMNYAARPPMDEGHMLDNVFVDPAAWRVFQQTGRWPDQTVFVKEDRAAVTAGSINKFGDYQTEEIMAVEFHVHDEARFTGGWGFFVTTGDAPAKFVPYDAACYSCHQAHGAVDTTFTQFYPTAKPIAAEAGTLRAETGGP